MLPLRSLCLCEKTWTWCGPPSMGNYQEGLDLVQYTKSPIVFIFAITSVKQLVMVGGKGMEKGLVNVVQKKCCSTAPEAALRKGLRTIKLGPTGLNGAAMFFCWNAHCQLAALQPRKKKKAWKCATFDPSKKFRAQSPSSPNNRVTNLRLIQTTRITWAGATFCNYWQGAILIVYPIHRCAWLHKT